MTRRQQTREELQALSDHGGCPLWCCRKSRFDHDFQEGCICGTIGTYEHESKEDKASENRSVIYHG